MICFPLDNKKNCQAKELRAWFATRTRGVFSADNNLAVYTNGGMNVRVKEGMAWCKYDERGGVVIGCENEQTLTIEKADSSLNRIDAVCLRMNKIANEAEIIIKKGSYASNPVITPPERNSNYDEIYLATVRVNAGTINMTNALITDQRLNEQYCGIMRDGVTGIPTQQLYDQWLAWFNETKASEEEKSELLSEWVEIFKSDKNNEFDEWFQTAKNTLNEDSAGKLLNMIESLDDKKLDKTGGTISGVLNVNGALQKSGSNVITTVGGSISGNLNVTGNLQKSGANVITTAGGTITGATNFTDKLQQGGHNVMTQQKTIFSPNINSVFEPNGLKEIFKIGNMVSVTLSLKPKNNLPLGNPILISTNELPTKMQPTSVLHWSVPMFAGHTVVGIFAFKIENGSMHIVSADAWGVGGTIAFNVCYLVQ